MRPPHQSLRHGWPARYQQSLNQTEWQNTGEMDPRLSKLGLFANSIQLD